MMGRQRSHNDSGELDEHDQPTEPALPVVLPPLSPTIPYGVPTVANENIPAPSPHERPFPYQDVPYSNSAYPPYAVPSGAPVYPVLPPVPHSQGGRPPGGAAPGYPVGAGSNAPTIGSRARRSSLPLLVGMFFVLVQLLLLVRFILMLLTFPASTTWVGTIYTLSSVFVLPFRLPLQSVAPGLPSSIELYTLLAILIYGLLSRLLVRFLKALLR
jgi:hypothetical protein